MVGKHRVMALLIVVGLLCGSRANRQLSVAWSGPTVPKAPVAKLVTATADSYIYEGRHTTQFPVVDQVSAGESLTFLDSAEGWVEVKTTGGKRGWLPGSIAEIREGKAQYAVAPGSWQVALAGGVRLTLTEKPAGALTLAVAAPVKKLGSPVMRGSALFVPVPTGQRLLQLPVNAVGVRQIGVEPDGLFLSFDQVPGDRTVASANGRISVTMRPRITQVSEQSQPDGTLYAVQVEGLASPLTKAEGGRVNLFVPGATAPGVRSPAGMTLSTNAEGVLFSWESTRPFALKRMPGGFALELYRPGLAGKRIMIDPGHGGADAGAVNTKLGLQEKTLNWAVSQRIKEELEARGAEVMLTRGADTFADLKRRSAMANDRQADLLLSIHHNANSGGMSGTESFFSANVLNGERSEALAALVQAEVVAATGQVDRGTKPELFSVTRNTDAPAVLIELGFVDNPTEADRLQSASFQHKVAIAMAAAVERFFAQRSPPQR